VEADGTVGRATLEWDACAASADTGDRGVIHWMRFSSEKRSGNQRVRAHFFVHFDPTIKAALRAAFTSINDQARPSLRYFSRSLQ
jgi:hypothetical protein